MAAQRNKVSQLLPRPDAALLQLDRRGRGDPFRSLRPVSFHFCLMGWLLAFFCFKGAAMAAGAAEVWRLDLARFPLGGGGRRRRGSIQESEVLGCVPGRRAFADGFCYCNSNKASVRWGFSNSR